MQPDLERLLVIERQLAQMQGEVSRVLNLVKDLILERMNAPAQS